MVSYSQFSKLSTANNENGIGLELPLLDVSFSIIVNCNGDIWVGLSVGDRFKFTFESVSTYLVGANDRDFGYAFIDTSLDCKLGY